MDGEQHLNQTLAAGQIVAWLVKDAVTQPGTDQHTDEAIEEEGFKLLVLYLLLLIQLLYNEIGQQQAHTPQQRIPTHTESTHRKGLHRRLPVNKKHVHHTLNLKCMMSPSCTT